MKKMKLLFLLIVLSLVVPVFSVGADEYMETSLPNLLDISGVEVYQPFLDDLERVTGLKVTFVEGRKPDTFNKVAAGTLNFGTGLVRQSGIPAMELYYSMPFGMEGQEFISWLYNGGGLELQREIYDSRFVVPIPFKVTISDAGGWFREKITKRYLNSGNMRMRLFGFGAEVLTRAFPKVTTPDDTGASPLDDFKSFHFTDLEFSFPTLDKQQLFDIPRESGDGITIIDAGARHYYISSWWQSYTYSEVWINKDFYDGLDPEVQYKIGPITNKKALFCRPMTGFVL